MVKSTLEKPHKCGFHGAAWSAVVENAALSLNLDESEKKRVRKCPVIKLLAALPYYAGCKNPDQLAVFKVGMYMTAYRNQDLFFHRGNQSIRERIQPATICPTGNRKVINLVTTFLELISINDHLADLNDDIHTGHPNPICNNELYYYARKEQLIREIESYPDQELVEELTRIADPVKLNYWGL